jgi:hypothetical protein
MTLANEALFQGGLSGAVAFTAQGRAGEAIWFATVIAVCALILAGGIILAEIGRLKVRQYVRKHEPSKVPEPRNEERPDA